MKTLYDILEVSETATQGVIRNAYKHLAQRWHPDKNPGHEQACNQSLQWLNRAYEVLSDPHKRMLYDRQLARRRQPPKSDSKASPDTDAAPLEPDASTSPAAPSVWQRRLTVFLNGARIYWSGLVLAFGLAALGTIMVLVVYRLPTVSRAAGIGFVAIASLNAGYHMLFAVFPESESRRTFDRSFVRIWITRGAAATAFWFSVTAVCAAPVVAIMLDRSGFPYMRSWPGVSVYAGIIVLGGLVEQLYHWFFPPDNVAADSPSE